MLHFSFTDFSPRCLIFTVQSMTSFTLGYKTSQVVITFQVVFCLNNQPSFPMVNERSVYVWEERNADLFFVWWWYCPSFQKLILLGRLSRDSSQKTPLRFNTRRNFMTKLILACMKKNDHSLSKDSPWRLFKVLFLLGQTFSRPSFFCFPLPLLITNANVCFGFCTD